MKKFLSFAAAGAALLSVCAAPGMASATTITLVTSAGTGMTALQVGPQGIGGFVDGTTALSFSADWVEFYMTPAGTNTTVTVDDLAGALYPGEQWEITGPGLATGAETANDIPTPSLFRLPVARTTTTSGSLPAHPRRWMVAAPTFRSLSRLVQVPRLRSLVPLRCLPVA